MEKYPKIKRLSLTKKRTGKEFLYAKLRKLNREGKIPLETTITDPEIKLTRKRGHVDRNIVEQVAAIAFLALDLTLYHGYALPI